MTTPSWLVRLVVLLATVVNLFAAFYLGVRPWYLRWGASDAELQRAWPGDSVVLTPGRERDTTRAISIQAPVHEIWPWLAQLGQNRAGFYSYELLEDLLGCEMPSTDRIHPELQDWQPGDKLWMYPPSKIDGLGHALLVQYQPGHALVFATRQPGRSGDELYDGSWSFIVEPQSPAMTRLVVRGRASGTRSIWGSLFDNLLFEPVHFMMERKMMDEIKARAEGQPPSAAWDNAQLATYLGAFLLAVFSAILVFRRREWVGALVSFIAASVLLQVLTFVQPSATLGGWLLLAAGGTLWWPRARSGSQGGGRRHTPCNGARHGQQATPLPDPGT